MVSIIMPVYNAQEYLDRSICSVINQGYSDWELIIVNDCSTDDSLNICQHYADRDTRIKVVTMKENSGPAAARNAGIDAFKGNYLAFIDSDDTFEPDFLQKMVDNADAWHADIVWCNYNEVYVDGHKETRLHRIPSHKLLNTRELISLFFIPTTGLGSLCNKMYRREVIEFSHIRLNTDRVRAEDWEFNMAVFQKATSAIAIKDSLYNYQRVNDQSIMASYRRKDFELMCQSQSLLLDLAKRNDIKINKGYLWGSFLYNMICYLQLMYKHEHLKKERLHEICNNPMFRQALQHGCCNHLTLLQKCIYLCIKREWYFPTAILLTIR